MRLKTAGLIAALALLAPAFAAAQPSTKVARIGILSGVPRSAPTHVAFEQKLRELGYVDGQNLAIEFRSAEGRADRFPALAAELVRLKVDVIVAVATEAALRAAWQATSTIPIVMVAVGYDPVALGYVSGLARPGGAITGVFFQHLELIAKRLQLLKEAVPKITRVAVLWDVFATDQLKEAEAAARSLGIQLQPVELRDPYDFDGAFRAARGRAGALLVLMSPVFFRERARIADLAAKHRLPAMFGVREFAEAGGLMAYGATISEMFRLAAEYVDKILKGARPADLPVQQPTRFELVLNLRTAKALGLTLPQSLLIRADKVIE